jgi:hypothetical protein
MCMVLCILCVSLHKPEFSKNECVYGYFCTDYTFRVSLTFVSVVINCRLQTGVEPTIEMSFTAFVDYT